MFDIKEIRAEFPILERKIYDNPLCYLDNGASAQKPKIVIEAIHRAYSFEYANVHRGLHFLSNTATDRFEAVREKIQKFLGAKFNDEIVFTSGTTEGLNLVSYAWGQHNLNEGDEIILSVMEHHANIVPWHFIRQKKGVVLKWVEPRSDGSLPPEDVLKAISPRTKLIAITHMSNVLGSIVDVKKICDSKLTKNIPVLVDGSQAAVHINVNVQELGCDFYAVTGHKLYGPSGSGAIYVSRKRMKEMEPFMGGGSMISDVKRCSVAFNTIPHKFEAGTPGIVGMIGLGAAIDFIQDVGLENIKKHEDELKNYAEEKLTNLSWLSVQGTALEKGAIFSFTMNGSAHPHDLSTILDRKGVAVRAGQHCAQPLMDHLGIAASCRASFAMYNSKTEVDILIKGLKHCYNLLN
ncbi:MAG: cysteine desulfurase [Paracoccaceae bacterium]|nr:cysteine desulfurase [Paracoccaceae bacterium]